MMEQIKQCPYCGSEEGYLDGFLGRRKVVCGCGATGPGGKTDTDAILLWNAAANQIEAKDEEIARLDAEYIKMIEQMRKERDEAIEQRDYWNQAWEYNYKYWQLEYRSLSDKYSETIKERDEARRVAKVWYNAAGYWKERYEANDVDAISDELMKYCQPRKVTIYPTTTGTAGNYQYLYDSHTGQGYIVHTARTEPPNSRVETEREACE